MSPNRAFYGIHSTMPKSWKDDMDWSRVTMFPKINPPSSPENAKDRLPAPETRPQPPGRIVNLLATLVALIVRLVVWLIKAAVFITVLFLCGQAYGAIGILIAISVFGLLALWRIAVLLSRRS